MLIVKEIVVSEAEGLGEETRFYDWRSVITLRQFCKCFN